MSAQAATAVQNHLLASLPPAELARLKPKLRRVELRLKQALDRSDVPLEHVYFPQQGMISLVRPMLDGSVVEVGVVGREGFVGLTVVLGTEIDFTQKMVQIEGSAWRIPVGTLRKELAESPALNAQLLRFAQALLIQVSQNAACNARHTVQERLARWLLMARDRNSDDNDDDVVRLSHEFLSMMLGARRSGVTVVLGAFRNAGLITYKHGRIEILDQTGLESACCECYGEVREAYKRLLH